MLRARIALAIGLSITVAATGAVLSSSPPAVLATNSVSEQEELSITSAKSIRLCQAHERIPAGTRSIQASIDTLTGPRLQVAVYADGRTVTSGGLGTDWSGRGVPIPVEAVRRTVSSAEVCFTSKLVNEPIVIYGSPSELSDEARANEQPVGGRITIVYLGKGRTSWLARARSVAKDMAFGRAWSGAWIAPFLVVLMIAGAVIASTVLLSAYEDRRSTPLGTRLRRVPAAAWLCALLACLNALSWSFITPPFQVPDEPAHVAYVKQLAETASLPTSNGNDLSEEEEVAMTALRSSVIRFDAGRKAIFSSSQQRKLDKALQSLASSSKPGSPDAGVAKSQPPLYYALESIPYRLGDTLLERIQLMRLLSALFAGLTTIFGFLFLREALPGARPAWTVGGLGIALSPLLGFMSGGVNPDAMLFAVSAVAFYCVARAFHRGLTDRGAIAIGAVSAVGLATKLTFIGLLPGILAGLVLLSIRATRAGGRAAHRPLALALAITFSPLVLYAGLNVLSHHPLLGLVSGASNTASRSPLAELDYVWQLYLPHLPGTVDYFPGLFTARQIWFDDYVGQFGWLDTYFPGWVYSFAGVLAGLILCLCVRALVAARSILRRRLPELATYLLMALGLLALIGAAGFTAFPLQTAGYGQARYLLPLLALLAAVLALATRGAGRRFEPVVGALLVSLLIAHNLFSELQVVARYYG
jgi:Predicted membrane protein (DUF2142)